MVVNVRRDGAREDDVRRQGAREHVVDVRTRRRGFKEGVKMVQEDVVVVQS